MAVSRGCAPTARSCATGRVATPQRCRDLAAAENGGQAMYANDQHFGSMHNLLLPGRGKDMGDGWETRRRRGPGNDFVVVRLGHPGTIEHVELDTAHFKGNYPDRASLRAALITGVADDARRRGRRRLAAPASESWPEVLEQQKLAADHVHVWTRRARGRRTGEPPPARHLSRRRRLAPAVASRGARRHPAR